MPTKNTSVPVKSTQNFPVVGIGASAGGLDAFKRLIETIPHNSGMAFVRVQHLAPSHESILAEILAKYTDLPVHEIIDEINIAPNNIYIIPENKMLTASEGALKLSPRDVSKHKNMPIDLFFTTLAETHGSFAVGVVLSGAGFDGSRGLQTIKEHGGITYAQRPNSATFDSMPNNAINTGSVDFILPPEDIPNHLLHVNEAYRANHAYADDLELSPDEDDVFKHILRIVRLRSGNDFTNYKQPTIRRRIARRMVVNKMEDPAAYVKFLRHNLEEQDALFNDILIPVTNFFRDGKTFDILSEAVFPLLLKNKKPEENLRIWSAGCSTGEEAYSLAISLHEFLADKAPGLKVQIFASDISEAVIVKARAAKYSWQQLQFMSEERVQKYFSKADGVFHVSKAIRDMCVFAVHNFVKDPPFAKMDLVSCRNALIYLNPTLQKKALTTFHYALRDHGVLLLGKSEAVTTTANLFTPLLKNHKIYSRKSVPGDFQMNRYDRATPNEHSEKKQAPIKKMPQPLPDFQKLAYDLLFNKYTPAAVVINAQKDIVHFHGDTSPFLLMAPGKPNFNILKMARPGLAFELQNILLKSKESGNRKITGSLVTMPHEDYQVEVDLIPLQTSEERFHLVLFHKQPIHIEKRNKALSANEEAQHRIAQLEAELDQLRDDIRRVNEDHETSNEELQSANEELLSNSEELQSLNEELETSTEELQSNNEELISVNDELMDRQEQLVSARQYSEAIVDTIREALLILDKDLRVRSANSAFYKFFNTKESETEGMLISELSQRQFNIPELKSELRKIIPEKARIEDYEITANFPPTGQRTLVLNARQIVNDRYSEPLILVAFDDITEIKISRLLRESEERFRVLADTAPVLLWISGIDKRGSFFNKGWLDFTGRTIEEELGEGWIENIHPEDREHAVQVYVENFDQRKEYYVEYRLKRHDGEYRWVSVKGVPRFTENKKFLGYVGGCMDIHTQKNFAAALEEQVEQRTRDLQESQSFLQSVLDTTQNLIYIFDFEKNKITFINGKASEVTGYTAAEIEDSPNDLFTPLIHKDDLPTVLAQRDILRNNPDDKIATVEFRLKNAANGWTCQLSRDLVFKRDANGKALMYLGVCTDISDLKNANELLLAKNRELEHSNIELASFSSIASHDLKEPLRKIQIFSKLVIAKDRAIV
ncbi:MAG TPA: CheR family methyltransferase, partial [Flavobacterium sp.]|nr:CheR family methyltransferase [Flavobacterium sp.]